ncbi:MAG: type II toxin-antitoxin system RelE/ParE family toxin [Rikenellaceae bacterium]
MNLNAKFRVELHDEAVEFLRRVDVKTREKIVSNMHKASLCLDPKLLKKLTGDIWEFRTLYAGKQYRMLAFWDKRDGKETLVIATHGFIKKVSKVPQKEIDKAKNIMELYFQRR